jgi:cytochrome c biogenesis protein CcmG, thiol:disulfide interchange protein DsbE
MRGAARGAAGRHPTRLAARPWANQWIPAAAVVTSVGLLAALFAFGLGRNPSIVQPAIEGKSAPAFTLRSLDGSRGYSLRELRGQVIVLNFWASWCADCIAEHPSLQRAFARYRDEKVVFLGVSFEDSTRAAQSFARQMGVGWPLLADPGSATAIDYGVTGVPETFVIGPDGRIVAKTIGPVAYASLSRQIARAAAGGA